MGVLRSTESQGARLQRSQAKVSDISDESSSFVETGYNMYSKARAYVQAQTTWE